MTTSLINAIRRTLTIIGTAYIGIGCLFAAVSMISAVIFSAVGPGAIWNIGLKAALMAGFFNMISAALRIFTWPAAIYGVVTGEHGFFEWLFYIWY